MDSNANFGAKLKKKTLLFASMITVVVDLC
jgi:hypothetical protein